MRLLLAWHDEHAARKTEAALNHEGFRVLRARDGHETLRKIYEEELACLIVSSNLPPMGGTWICRWTRTDMALASLPIILINEDDHATSSSNQRDVGADYYINEPVDTAQLLSFIRSLKNTEAMYLRDRVYTAGEITMVTDRWFVTISGEQVKLTEKEYRLLYDLLRAKGNVVTREELLKHVWGYEESLNIHTRTLDVHMSRLRQKLGRFSRSIITIRNIGYRIDASVMNQLRV